MSDRAHYKQHQAYCQKLEEMQALCKQLDLNFKTEMMMLAEFWIEQHQGMTKENDGE